MKRNCIVCGFLLCLVFMMPAPSWSAGDWTGNVNFTLGVKALDDDDWEPVEDQVELGINVDFGRIEWPINIAIAIVGSRAEEHAVIQGINVDADGSTGELRFGVRKIWQPTQTMRPFLGGGLALISAELDGRALGLSVNDDDTGFGIWINGGVYWTLGNSFNLGLEFGYSKGEVTLFDEDGDAGGGHAALLLGYHW